MLLHEESKLNLRECGRSLMQKMSISTCQRIYLSSNMPTKLKDEICAAAKPSTMQVVCHAHVVSQKVVKTEAILLLGSLTCCNGHGNHTLMA